MYAQAHECPNCGAPVAFASAVTVFAVCAYCRSNVVRRDAAVETMGVQAQLPPDLSPLQVGTQGRFDGLGFTLIGRLRVGYDGGSWNEWCALFSDGRWGWVAESMGLYQVSFEVAPPAGLELLERWHRARAEHGDDPAFSVSRLAEGREAVKLGQQLRLGGAVLYTVRDVKDCVCLGSEGELPFAALPGRPAVSIDLGGEAGGFANVEYSDEGVRVFLGRVCRFEELELTGLRPLPGWNAEAEVIRRSADALGCPRCGAPVELRASGLTMAATCPSCGSLIDTSNPQLRLIARAKERQILPPLIPIGRRGTLDGYEFECIGFLRKRDDAGDQWFEYLLFNPWGGFRWLVTYQGHWSLVRTLPSAPRTVGEERVWDGVPYRLFARGGAAVNYVFGEFYWQVRVGEKTQGEDYVAPPRVLSSEKYPQLDEVTWSQGEYLDRAVVQSAFGLPEPLREPDGVYLNQPNPHADRGRTLRWLLPLLAGVFTVIWMATLATRAREQVLSVRVPFVRPTGGTNASVATAPFTIGGTRPQAVRLELGTDVSQGWMEVGADLVNLDTQEIRETTLAAEFYYGEDDGYWSEGSREGSALLSAVKPGRYQLVLEPEGEPGVEPAEFTVRVVRDVPVWSNFWLGLIGLLAYPVYRWVREFAFETTRWSQSDFSPYPSWTSEDDDDEGGDWIGVDSDD